MKAVAPIGLSFLGRNNNDYTATGYRGSEMSSSNESEEHLHAFGATPLRRPLSWKLDSHMKSHRRHERRGFNLFMFRPPQISGAKSDSPVLFADPTGDQRKLNAAMPIIRTRKTKRASLRRA